MTHDPLCPTAGWPTQPCACDVIARVRADEQRRYLDGLDRIIHQHGAGENP